MIELQEDIKEEMNLAPSASLKVIGVGGAGGNTVNSIIESGCTGIKSIAVNTDAQALHFSKAEHKIQIGVKSTKGLGTGANPDLGKRSAEEDLEKIMDTLVDTDIAFLTAGMGGGTGSGATPTIARALREHNILTIAIVTLPFEFEGKRKARVARETIKSLNQEVDTLIIIPNQKLLDVVDKHVPMLDAFAMINDVLTQSVTGITDIITKPGHINVDFADVRTIMKGMGLAVMGSARASGENRAEEATFKAIASPLLENMRIRGASAVLLNITGGKNLSLHEISQAAQTVYEEVAEDAHIILGSVIDDQLEDEINVTLIATGFENEPEESTQPESSCAENVNNKKSICAARHAEQEEDIVTHVEKSIEKNMEPHLNKSIEKDTDKSEATNQHDESLSKSSSEIDEYQITKREVKPFDMNNFDIPTFMRKEHAEEKNED